MGRCARGSLTLVQLHLAVIRAGEEGEEQARASARRVRNAESSLTALRFQHAQQAHKIRLQASCLPLPCALLRRRSLTAARLQEADIQALRARLQGVTPRALPTRGSRDSAATQPHMEVSGPVPQPAQRSGRDAAAPRPTAPRTRRALRTARVAGLDAELTASVESVLQELRAQLAAARAEAAALRGREEALQRQVQRRERELQRLGGAAAQARTPDALRAELMATQAQQINRQLTVQVRACAPTRRRAGA